MEKKNRVSMEIEIEHLPSEVEIEYDYEPYRSATRIEPAEGGVTITGVKWIRETKVGPNVAVDIKAVLPEKLIQKWEEEIWDSIQNYEPEYEKD